MSKFEELRDVRLPVALRKIELLGNLGRPSYGATEAQRREIASKLNDAVGDLIERYRLTRASTPPAPPPKPSAIPPGHATGGASFEAEVRWALDAIKRGDTKLAEARLKRCLGHEEN